jgi:hypothetical protein
MRVVELSNHPGEMLGDAARRRQAAEQRVLSVYEDELIRYRARVQTVRVRRDRARAGRRWWTWLRLSLAVWREKRGLPRPPVPAAGHPTDLEEKIMAGIAGEQLDEPTDDLERFLAERGQPAGIGRVVILAHRRSGLGPVRNPTVEAFTSPGDLLALIGNSASRLDRGQRAAIAALIRRDHEFHGQHRRGGTRPPR